MEEKHYVTQPQRPSWDWWIIDLLYGRTELSTVDSLVSKSSAGMPKVNNRRQKCNTNV
jgi:hypothetical protein